MSNDSKNGIHFALRCTVLEKGSCVKVDLNLFLSVQDVSMPYLETLTIPFLDATTNLYKRLCLLVRPSVRPSVPCYFRTTKIAVFEVFEVIEVTMFA